MSLETGIACMQSHHFSTYDNTAGPSASLQTSQLKLIPRSMSSAAFDVTQGQLLTLPAFNQKKLADAEALYCTAAFSDTYTIRSESWNGNARDTNIKNNPSNASKDFWSQASTTDETEQKQVNPSQESHDEWRGPLLPLGTWAVGIDLTRHTPFVRPIDLINSHKFLLNGCAELPPSSSRMRVENLLWRKWWQTQNALVELSPQEIKWDKGLDVTYVIGTVYVVADPPVPTTCKTEHVPALGFAESSEFTSNANDTLDHFGNFFSPPPSYLKLASSSPSSTFASLSSSSIYTRRESIASSSSATSSFASRLSISSCTSSQSTISTAFSVQNSLSSYASPHLHSSCPNETTKAKSCMRPLKSCLKQQPLAIGPEWMQMLAWLKAHPDLSPKKKRIIMDLLIVPLLQPISSAPKAHKHKTAFTPAQPNCDASKPVTCPSCNAETSLGHPRCRCQRLDQTNMQRSSFTHRYIPFRSRPIIRRASLDSSQECTVLTLGEHVTDDLKIKFDFPGNLRRDDESKVSFNWTVQQRRSIDPNIDADTEDDDEVGQQTQCGSDSPLNQDSCAIEGSSLSKEINYNPSISKSLLDSDLESPWNPPLANYWNDSDDSDYTDDESLCTFNQGERNRSNLQSRLPPHAQRHYRSTTTEPPIDSLPEMLLINNARIIPTQPTTPTGILPNSLAQSPASACSTPSGRSRQKYLERMQRRKCLSAYPQQPTLSTVMTPALLKLDANTIFLPSTSDVDAQVLIPLLNATLEPTSPRRFQTAFIEAPTVPTTSEEAAFGQKCLDTAFSYYEDKWMDTHEGCLESCDAHYNDLPPIRSNTSNAVIANDLRRDHSFCYFDRNHVLHHRSHAFQHHNNEKIETQSERAVEWINTVAEVAVGVVDSMHCIAECLDDMSSSVQKLWTAFKYVPFG